MARSDSRLHDTGDFFPIIEFTTTSGDEVVLPGDYIGNWSVVLFYRGHW